MSAPSHYSRTPFNRDVTHNALLGATTKLESAPPRCVGGNCGWAGRAGEPLLGARGYADRVRDMPVVTGGKSTNCGSGAWN